MAKDLFIYLYDIIFTSMWVYESKFQTKQQYQCTLLNTFSLQTFPTKF